MGTKKCKQFLLAWVGIWVCGLGMACQLQVSLNDKVDANNDIIKIGVIADLTGNMARDGNWVKNGAQIVADEINQAGGKIKLIIEDGKSESQSSVAAINKLVDVDQVKMIVAGNGSSGLMAIAPIANNNQVIVLAGLASSPTITQAGEYVFRNRISGTFECQDMARFARQKGFKRVAIMFMNNEAGKPYAQAFQQEFEKLGGVITDQEFFDPNETNFKSQMVKILINQPEAVFVGSTADIGVLIIKQSLELNFKPIWLGVSSWRAEKILELDDKTKDEIFFTTEMIDTESSAYVKLNQEYRRRFNEEANGYAVNGYDAVKILYSVASQKGMGDPSQIKDGLLSLTGYNGAGGEIKFDTNGDAVRSLQRMKIIGDQFVVIED